jgi:hypothetical protein
MSILHWIVGVSIRKIVDKAKSHEIHQGKFRGELKEKIQKICNSEKANVQSIYECAQCRIYSPDLKFRDGASN